MMNDVDHPVQPIPRKPDFIDACKWLQRIEKAVEQGASREMFEGDNGEAQLERWEEQHKPKPKPRPDRELNGGLSTGRKRHIALKILDSVEDQLSRAPEGTRDDATGRAILDLGKFVHEGYLSESEVRDAVVRAAYANGLSDDRENGGIEKVERDVPRALATALERGYTVDWARFDWLFDDDESSTVKGEINARTSEPTWTFVNGASFILDVPDKIPALWGEGDNVLWAEGESLMVAGPMGLGKTTLILRGMHAQLDCGDGTLLGLPVAERPGIILYLAMDRPAQIARAAHRIFGEQDRDVLRERVRFWQGPPPADIAKNPGLLLALAEAAGAQTVYLDSIKDAAVGLSEDEVGAGYNRARQLLLANGVQLAEAHHTVKRSAAGGPPHSVADIYGSAWITNGTGSIVLLSGEPGDPIVSFRHVRAPANEVGPWRLLHDQTTGALTIDHAVDLVALVRLSGVDGLTAKAAAAAITEKSSPRRADVEKARRRLDQLAADGVLARVDGSAGRGSTTAWFMAERWHE